MRQKTKISHSLLLLKKRKSIEKSILCYNLFQKPDTSNALPKLRPHLHDYQ